MPPNINNEIINQLTDAMQAGDWREFGTLRTTQGDPGYPCHIDNQDISSRDLSGMPVDFVCFRSSDLTMSSFSGVHFLPTALWRCDARGVDLRGSSGMLFAYGCDLRGAKFDDTTNLTTSNSGELSSTFKDCLLDDSFKLFLTEQGVSFEFPSHWSIESYAFGMTKEHFLSDTLVNLRTSDQSL